MGNLGSWTRALWAMPLFLFAKGGIVLAGSDGVCFQDPEQLFKTQSQIEIVYECGQAGESQLCKSAINDDCRKIRVQDGIERLSSSRYILGNKSTSAAQGLIKNQSPRKQLLAAYLSAMDYSEGIIIDPLLSIQTGQYPQVMVSPQALNSKCMATIVQAAYKLHTYFSNYSFVIDSHIQNCNNLRDGIKQIVAERERVKKNLDKFNSPLHSVFLSNQSRFVSRELGKMGLHINVDRSGEMRKRLIDFEISGIPNDGPKTSLTGL